MARASLAACAVLAAFATVACGTDATNKTGTTSRSVAGSAGADKATAGADKATGKRVADPRPSYPRLLRSATNPRPTGFVPAVTWRRQTAVWIARSGSRIALLSFNQRLIELRLHAGTEDPGSSGWRLGPEVAGAERQRLVAAFNGGFKLNIGAGGFFSQGRDAVPLQHGLGSIVTYTDGYTDIGAWRQDVPGARSQVASVRQNLTLLISGGRSASTLNCLTCWGATLGGVSDPARSALGITADGHLVWAGGENLTTMQLADALLAAHVVRAVELDINPEWVAGYLYGHRGGRGPLAPVPIVPSQQGLPGQFLSPWTRDFFALAVR